MPADTVLKKSIQIALSNFEGKPLAEASRGLLAALGYESNKTLVITPNTAQTFQAMFDPRKQMKADAKLDEWQSVDLLFQVTGDELGETLSKQGQLFANQKVDNALIESYLFFAIALKGGKYSRTELANITREVNKCFKMPALVIFKHGKTLTFSIIARRISKRDESKDVLEKVTLIKDVRFAENRAHIEILHDLALPQLAQKHKVSNFVELQRAWEKTLDTSELNKKFFKEIANWYFWAVKSVEYPKGAGAEEEARNAISVIRLITRLIFVWFIKEKGLVPEALFEREKVKSLLNDFSMEESTYYLAVLQNLFFATLNTEMGAARKFRGENKNEDGRKQNYMAHTLYRHRPLFRDADAALSLFAGIPFLNGGLFECLDRSEKVNGKDVVIRVDGFSDEAKNQPRVPNILFFGAEQDVDLNAIYDTKNKRYEVGGLIEIFRSYKFTIEENTPIEEEIALDPELFGKVFENLLAAYNPETGTTARKQTGSFYTPREIVNYMVDESLVAYLDSAMSLRDGALPSKQSPTGEAGIASLGLDTPKSTATRPALAMTDRIRALLAYTPEPPQFTEAEKTQLIAAIDNLKALDPACGSGAFPMGILHKLVFILNKLDPRNERWKQKQISKAEDMQDAVAREAAIQSIEQVFADNFGDYGRKLFLIENCIYGVDIQPIAVQIAKLRFFISLVVEQKIDSAKENLGIRPLPNLETKFVAANTLIGIERPRETAAQSDSASLSPELESQFKLLISAFEQYTKSRNPDVKTKWLNQGKQTAEAINAALKDDLSSFQPINAEWTFTTAASVDVLKAQLPMKREAKAVSLTLRSQDVKAKEDELARVRRAHFSARTQATKTKYRNQDTKLRAEIATLLTQTHALEDATAQKLANWDPYNQNAHADFFDPEWMFGVEGGFDVVIGNPPYVDSENMVRNNPRERTLIAEKFETTKGNWDLYIPFWEQSIKLSTPKGVSTLITPNKWLSISYGKALRNYSQQLLYHVIDYSKFRAFENTGIFAVVAFMSKSRHSKLRVESYVDKDTLAFELLLPADLPSKFETWGVFLSENLPLLLKLIENGTKLNKVCDIEEPFTVSEAYLLSEYLSESTKVKGKHFRFVNTGTIDPYAPLWGKKLTTYLKKKYNTPIILETDLKENFPRRYEQSKDSKIIISGIRHFESFLDENGEWVAGKSTVICRNFAKGTSPRFLLGILNSRLIAFFLRECYGSLSMDGGINFSPTNVSEIPIAGLDKQKDITNLVTQILAAKRANPRADVSALEREIDRLVYQLYGLTPEEIAIVEAVS